MAYPNPHRKIYRRIIFGSALMLSLLAQVDAKAEEPLKDNTYELSESENLTTIEDITNYLIANESLDLDMTVLKFLETTKDLHNKNEYEEARFNYTILLNYPDLKANLADQVDSNLTALEQQESFVEWELSDALGEYYRILTLETVISELDESFLQAYFELHHAEEILEESQREPLNVDEESLSDPETEENSEKETEEANSDENIMEQETVAKGTELDESEETQEEQTDDSSADTESDSEVTTETKLMVATSSTDPKEAEKEALYQASINGSNASEAWSIALDGFDLYPGDDRFKEAIELAAARNIKWAETLEGRGSYDRAIWYYNRVLKAPWLSSETETYVNNIKARAQRSATESDRQAMYLASVNGKNGSEAWNLALDGYEAYPEDDRFKEAIELAAARNIKWAETLEGRGSYDRALVYYNRLLDAPWLSAETTAYVQEAKDRAQYGDSEAERKAMYEASINGANASEAWSKALDGFDTYPEDDRFKEAIESAAERNYTWAETLEDRGSYDRALFYYNRILRAPWLSSETRSYVENAKQRAQYGESEAEREAMYQASVNGSSGSQAWKLALEGYDAYPEDDRFKEAIELAAARNIKWAETLEDRGSYDRAIWYFNRVLNGPWLSSETRAYAENAKQRAQYGESEAEREAMYQASVNGSSGSQAWKLALEGYEAYPEDDRFKEAIELAAARNIKWAETLEDRGSYDRALFYYNRLLGGPWLSAETETLVENNKARAIESKTEALYQASVNESNPNLAWDKALEGFNTYPGDNRFKKAIELAAEKNIKQGEKHEENEAFKDALVYFNRVNDAPWLSVETEAYVTEAIQRVNRIMEIGLLYYRAENAEDTSTKWSIILEGLDQYSKEQTFKDMVSVTADDLLNEAVSDHLNKAYAEATKKYNLILDGPDGFYSGKDIANKYYILSRNDLNIDQANYHFSYYGKSLNEALDAQMKRAPQTDADRQWVDASKDHVEYYLNPENFINGLEYEAHTDQYTGRVNTSALNVRSGSGTGHTAIDLIYSGQSVSIQGSESGWFKISYTKNNEARTGWVSSTFITMNSNNSEIKDLTDAYKPVAQVNATTLNVRIGPSTSYQAFTTVSRGSKYIIVKESNGWYQVQLNSEERGWLHGDYVTVSNTLDRNLMQYLKLSGTSGIKVEELNEELRNSGVLKDMGHVFIEASEQYNINENYLMAHAKLETGHGTSTLATGVLVSEVDGKAVTPKVVYNMYGIAAFDSSPLKSGSEYAYKQGWDTIEKSILGGAEWISKQYVNHSTHQQDTLYKMRWNPGSPGSHQYATDIGWAVKQTSSLNAVVELSQKYNIPIYFDIPVYRK